MWRTVAAAITGWDRHTFLLVNHELKCALFDAVMPRVSDLGLGHVQVLGVLLSALLCGWMRGEAAAATGRNPWAMLYRRRAWVGPLLVAFALSGLGSTLIKHNTDRDRPWWFYRNEHLAGRQLTVYVNTVEQRPPMRVRGFLSGHTATSFALATTAGILWWPRRSRRGLVIALWIAAALISFSRIYLADHWPVDVVCGAALGILCGMVAPEICRAWARRRLAVPAGALEESPSREMP